MSRSLHLIVGLEINFDVDYKPKMRGSFLSAIPSILYLYKSQHNRLLLLLL